MEKTVRVGRKWARPLTISEKTPQDGLTANRCGHVRPSMVGQHCAEQIGLRTPSNRVDFSHHLPQSMRDITNNNFGLLIAYVLPGFIGLSAVSHFSETVRSWLGTSSTFSPTVGGFLYVTLASTALGLLISTVRWSFVDRIHHLTGIREPHWDFSTLQDNFGAFEGLVQSHYRYYQFYANSLVAALMWYFAARMAGAMPGFPGWYDLSIGFVAAILFAGSRDTLRKYYGRGGELLGEKTYVSVDILVDQD